MHPRKIKELKLHMNIKKIGCAISKALVVPFLLIQSSVALAIDPPNNLRGIVQSPTQVQWEWDWVNGAANFEVTVDGQFRGLTPNPRFTTSDLWPGEHSLSVKAVDFNGQAVNAPSASVENRSTTTSSSVSVPSNLRAEEIAQSTVQWQWDWLPGVANYEVTVDGAVAGTTPDTQFSSQNLWPGEHSLTVKAISNDGQVSQASDTLKITVQSSFSGATAVAPPPPQNDPVAVAPPAPADDNGPIDPASYNYSEIYEKPGYELSFSDEFNNSTLNRNRWNTQLRWDGEFNGERQEYRVINGESQFYVNIFSDDQDHLNFVVPQHNPFELDGSRLAIRAIRNPLKTNNNNKDHGALREIVAQQEFLSGALTTYDKFTQKYGYFEARIKIPNHVGTFPAFWLHHQKRRYEGTRRTEIDIMENLGHAPWYIYNSFHYFSNVTSSFGGDPNFLKPQPEGQIFTGTDYSQDYHTYAVEWEPGHVR